MLFERLEQARDRQVAQRLASALHGPLLGDLHRLAALAAAARRQRRRGRGRRHRGGQLAARRIRRRIAQARRQDEALRFADPRVGHPQVLVQGWESSIVPARSSRSRPEPAHGAALRPMRRLQRGSRSLSSCPEYRSDPKHPPLYAPRFSSMPALGRVGDMHAPTQPPVVATRA